MRGESAMGGVGTLAASSRGAATGIHRRLAIVSVFDYLSRLYRKIIRCAESEDSSSFETS